MAIFKDREVAPSLAVMAQPQALDISCHDDPRGFDAVFAAAEDLTRGRTEPLLYLTPAYLSAYVQTFTDRRYALFLARRGGRVVGAAYFCLHQVGKLGVLRFVGEGLWGYSGVLTQDDGEAGAAVAAALLRGAAATCRPHQIEVGPLHASALDRHLAAVNRLGLRGELLKISGGAPWIDTTLDRAEWIRQRKKAAYSDALRCEKRLNEQGELAVFKIDNATLDPPQARVAMAAFMDMYRRQWSDSRFRRDPRWLDFYLRYAVAAARSGSLEFSFLTLAGRPLAAHFGCLHDGRRYYFTPTYDVEHARFSPGKVLLRHLIDASFEQAVVFDFQNDLETYKLDWSTGVADRYLIRLHTG
jgi:CelD/BcsL family acetyltransferase involved in cellulose biosynthesis